MQNKTAVCLFSLLVLFWNMGGMGARLPGGSAMKTAAQTMPVHLRGRVTKAELVREDARSIVFKLELDLELLNVSNLPVILMQQPYWLGATRLASSEEEAKANKYLYASGSWPFRVRWLGMERVATTPEPARSPVRSDAYS